MLSGSLRASQRRVAVWTGSISVSAQQAATRTVRRFFASEEGDKKKDIEGPDPNILAQFQRLDSAVWQKTEGRGAVPAHPLSKAAVSKSGTPADAFKKWVFAQKGNLLAALPSQEDLGMKIQRPYYPDPDEFLNHDPAFYNATHGTRMRPQMGTPVEKYLSTLDPEFLERTERFDAVKPPMHDMMEWYEKNGETGRLRSWKTYVKRMEAYWTSQQAATKAWRERHIESMKYQEETDTNWEQIRKEKFKKSPTPEEYRFPTQDGKFRPSQGHITVNLPDGHDNAKAAGTKEPPPRCFEKGEEDWRGNNLKRRLSTHIHKQAVYDPDLVQWGWTMNDYLETKPWKKSYIH